MLGNYLTTALRHLWRERGYAAINLFGLAVGLALCLLVIQLGAYQLSVGDFHENKDRIYRILGPTFWDSDRYTFALPIQLGPVLEDQLPQVEEAVRFTASRPTLLRAGTREGISEKVLTADPGVLRVFGFPLLRGAPGTALERPYTLVLTEPLARRLFGEGDPMGQVVRVDESFDCEVTGIVGQPPPGSLLQFSALLSFATELKENPGMTSGIVHAFTTFVQLTPGTAPAAVAARLPGVVEAITGVPATPAWTPAAGVSVQAGQVGQVGQGDLGQPVRTGKLHVFDGAPHDHPHPAEPGSLQETSVVTLPAPHDHPHPAAPERLQQTSVIHLPPEALELPRQASAGNPPSYVLQPLKSIYFDAEVPNNLGKKGNSTYLVVCALLAVVILAIAGVNYVNLATARAGRRIHEIGVRKALGAHRGQLIRQLLSESVLMSTAATVLGAVLAGAMLQLIPAIAGSAFDPIRRHSLEEVTARLYSEELRVGRSLTLLLLLAIAVAAVGLFGMAAHAAHERTREIGVRKVFGASAGGLTAMMLRDFARPVAIAFVLSVPVAWWLGNQWLHDFAYRVEMGAGLFAVSGALSFLVAGLTVSQQAIRASMTNPVETLRTE